MLFTDYIKFNGHSDSNWILQIPMNDKFELLLYSTSRKFDQSKILIS